MATDFYQVILHTLYYMAVGKPGCHWPQVGVVPYQGPLSCMYQYRIFMHVQIMKGEGEPGYEAKKFPLSSKHE